jgi:hypothetical protein
MVTDVTDAPPEVSANFLFVPVDVEARYMVVEPEVTGLPDWSCL